MKNPVKKYDSKRVVYPEIALLIVPIYYLYSYIPFLAEPEKRMVKLSQELRQAGFSSRADAVLTWMPRDKETEELKEEVGV